MVPLTRALGSYSPMIASASSVFPEPDAPTMATISPTCTAMLRSSITLENMRSDESSPALRYMSKPMDRCSTCSR